MGDEGFVQRVLDQQLLEFADQVGVPANLQVTLHPPQDGRPALLPQAGPHPGHPVTREAGECRASPEPVRLAQQLSRVFGVAVASQRVSLPAQAAELVQVDRLGIDVEFVATGAPCDLDFRSEGLPE